MRTCPVPCPFVVVLFIQRGTIVSMEQRSGEAAAKMLMHLSEEASEICAWLERGDLEGGCALSGGRGRHGISMRVWTVKVRRGFFRLVIENVLMPSQRRTVFYGTAKIARQAFVGMMRRALHGEYSVRSNQVSAAKRFFAAVRENASELSRELLAAKEAVMEGT